MNSSDFVFKIEPIKFTSVPMKSVRVEYFTEGDKVVFHFFPVKPPSFPSNIRSAITALFKSVVSAGAELFVEYVPEVNSWYTSVKNLPVGVTASYVKRWMEKLDEQLIAR